MLSDYIRPARNVFTCILGDTKWNSQLTCVETYIRNHPGYTCVANLHEDDMAKNTIKLIRDYNLLKHAKDFMKQLKPDQGDDVSIADACDSWLDQQYDVNLHPHLRAVNTRYKVAIQSMHYFAYLWHPKYRGSKLNKE